LWRWEKSKKLSAISVAAFEYNILFDVEAEMSNLYLSIHQSLSPNLSSYQLITLMSVIFTCVEITEKYEEILNTLQVRIFPNILLPLCLKNKNMNDVSKMTRVNQDILLTIINSFDKGKNLYNSLKKFNIACKKVIFGIRK